MRGEGRVFKRGRIWWIAYYGPGEKGAEEIRESGSESEAAARKLLKKRLRDVANHRNGVRAFTGPSAERLTVDNLIDSLEGDYRRRGIKSLRRTISVHRASRSCGQRRGRRPEPRRLGKSSTTTAALLSAT